ncbi:lasso peptide biosynthesis B2 protein [Moorena producens JHB]|uniref:Lasso peptide biosynthesis B2 protein n=1 Tax=Moorena producens (strain JHB) TaxID=1454205 RepID=A0A1D9G4A6_MOOP1|nr:lasso peptide biosynthesis B2 protein [Moorena producens]AOY82354.1 lasso peptide biosynthesis B2 protein [Moorena producens JHB]
MKQLRKFLRLTSRERQLVINTFILLGLIRLALWLLPFQTLRRLLAKISQPSPPAQRVNQTHLSKIVGAVNLSSRYMPGGVKCLARALTTQVLMSRCGYSPQLRIGVAKGEGGKLEAHAWVENQGQIVIGYLRDLSRFTPLPSFKGGKL